MKTIKPVTIKLLAPFVAIFFLFGCASKPTKPGSWVDDNIDGSISNKFHEQSTEFLKYIKTEDARRVNGMLSKELIADQKKTVRNVAHIRNALRKNDYTLFKEIYVINKWKDADTVALADGKNKFTMTYTGTAKEMYFAMFLPKNGDNKRMITLTYSNTDYGWRITKLEIMPYSVNGKTAPDLYKAAQDDESNKYYADAVTTIGMGVACAKPNEEWEYAVSKDMMNYYDKLVAEANTKFKFPMFIKNIGAPAAIFRIYDQRNDDGIFPTICYLTKINIKDTAAVHKENLKIQKVIGAIVPGIDKNKKFLLYSAYNKIPIDAYQEHYDMTEKL